MLMFDNQTTSGCDLDLNKEAERPLLISMRKCLKRFPWTGRFNFALL